MTSPGSEGIYRLAGVKSKVKRICTVLQHNTGAAGKGKVRDVISAYQLAYMRAPFREGGGGV